MHSPSWGLVALNLAQAPTQTSGLTQPQATIIAAVIAVIAAVIAFGGVLLNARISQRQHREKEAATLRDRNRKEAVDALVEALAASMAFWDLIGTVHSIEIGSDDFSKDDYPAQAQLNDARMAMTSAALKLELLDIASFKEMATLGKELDKIRNTAYRGANIETFDNSWNAREAMITSFKVTLKQIDSH